MYAGISIRPSNAWRIEAYTDFYKSPWLRYRVNAPSAGTDYLVQLNYKPNKQLELYTRFRAEAKAINANPEAFSTSPVVTIPKKNWRTHLHYRINKAISIRSRTEWVWFDKKGLAEEQGFLIYVDFIYKSMLKPYSGSFRMQYFETNGYNSRLYAFENDVLYSFSIPVFYNTGYRYYINMNYDINKWLTFWIRWAQTIYRDNSLIGSGLDELPGNKKSELRLQAMVKF